MATRSLGERLAESLQPVFDGGTPLVLTDSRALLSRLQAEEVSALHFDHLPGLTPPERVNIVAIPTAPTDVANHDTWHEYFSDSRVLIVPGVAFDPAPDAVVYTLEKIARSSFVDAARRNIKLLEAVTAARSMVVSSADAQLTCVLDEISMMRPKIEPELDVGEWESVGSYFEVGLVSAPDEFLTGIKTGFDVAGDFVADGVSVAVHRHVSNTVREMSAGAWALLRELARSGEFPLRLTVRDSVLRSVRTVSGREISTELLAFTNMALGGVLTEFSLSSNAAMRPDEIDWSVNSQMNEGAIGVHVAVGEGLTGAHIDFIAVDAQTRFNT